MRWEVKAGAKTKNHESKSGIDESRAGKKTERKLQVIGRVKAISTTDKVESDSTRQHQNKMSESGFGERAIWKVAKWIVAALV